MKKILILSLLCLLTLAADYDPPPPAPECKNAVIVSQTDLRSTFGHVADSGGLCQVVLSLPDGTTRTYLPGDPGDDDYLLEWAGDFMVSVWKQCPWCDPPLAAHYYIVTGRSIFIPMMAFRTAVAPEGYSIDGSSVAVWFWLPTACDAYISRAESNDATATITIEKISRNVLCTQQITPLELVFQFPQRIERVNYTVR